MLVPAAGGREKVVAAAVMGLSALRFLVTGVAELTGAPAWTTVARWTGLRLAAVSFHAASLFEPEGTDKHAVLPLWRRGSAASAIQQDEAEQLTDVVRATAGRRFAR